MKIITVCLKERAKSTKSRIDEINCLLNEIGERKITPNLCIFPGGTFDLKEISLTNPDKAERIKLITKEGIVAPLKTICKEHNLNLILGIDTKNAFDQCVCHVDEGGVKCITRKIFPVKGEQGNRWVSNVEDAKIENRVTQIKRIRFLLAACYDMYGAEILRHKNSQRLQNIKQLSKDNVRATKGTPLFDEFKEELISHWCKSVDSSDIGVACIHKFTKTGNGSGISYWQRHGITGQFSFLKMKTVLGAAHYTEGRPFPKDMSKAMLADGKSIKKELVNSYLLLNGKALVRIWSIGK